MGPRERECAARARTLAALAERHLAEREPWTRGRDATPDAAVGVALSLYREAAFAALGASTEETVLAGEVRAALGARAPEESAALSPDEARGDLDATKAVVRALLAEVDRARGDVDALFAERFVRVVAVVAALALLAAAPRLGWYAVHSDRGPEAPWTASSAVAGYVTAGRGFAQPDYKVPVFFHTDADASPSISFDLERVVDVRAVTVVNRGDCCDDRAVPMVVEVSDNGSTWREVARRVERFRRWEARFGRVAARWVRLRVTRPSHLHLESVAIR